MAPVAQRVGLPTAGERIAMPIYDKTRIFAGFDNLAGGMDAGRNPSLIEANQCASADNLVFRGGTPKTRPGIRITYRNHTNPHMLYGEDGFFDGDPGFGLNSASNFGTQSMQGACYYAPGGGKRECIMAMVGGRLYRITPLPSVGLAGFGETLEITEIALDKTNSPTLTKAFLVQADRFCVIQDGQSKPIVYDGVTAVRSDDIPVGTIMAYGMGRLIVVVHDNREIIFGDLYGSHDGDPGESVLKFDETGFLNEGGAASISFALGKISGLHFVPQQDTSVGDGELLAFSEGGMTTFQLALPRDQWKESKFQRVVLYNVGARGWRAIVSIGEDVWFRSDDGWRSYRQARAEQGGWAHLPMSTNVRTWTENDTVKLLDYGSAIYFDNRLIMTSTPYPNNGRLFHNGLLALDFDVLSSFGQAARPAWDGHWTVPDVRITQLVQGAFDGTHKAFMFTLFNPVSNYVNFIHEITRNDNDDYYSALEPIAVPIEWKLTPRSMDFESPYNEKELFGADVWVDEVKSADLTISLEYRPDQHPNWTTWQTLPSIAQVGTPGAIGAGGIPTLRANFFPRRTIEKPGDTVDSADFTGRVMRRGYEFQPRISGSGHCVIRKLRMHAKQLVEDDKNTE